MFNPFFFCTVVLAGLSSTLAQRSGTTQGNVFQGCNPTSPTVDGSTTRWSVSQSTTYTRGDNCAAACVASGFGALSYYSQQDKWCKCSLITPGSAQYTSGNQGGCANGQQEVYQLQTTFTQYQSYPCRSFDQFGGVTFQSIPQAGSKSCFQICRFNTYAFWRPTNGGYQCGCSDTNTNGAASAPVTCGNNQVFTYVHSAEARASGLNRRKAREEIEARQQSQTLCPQGLTACNVPDTEGAFECIDINSEVESCGGCMAGVFGSNSTVPAGEDCTRLVRAQSKRRSYTCQAGMCRLFGRSA